MRTRENDGTEWGYDLVCELLAVHEELVANVKSSPQICALIQAYATIRAAEVTADATYDQAKREASATIHAARVTTGQLESKYVRR